MSDDYISREAARPDAFCEGVSCQECPFCKDPIKGGCRVDDYIKDIPAADVRPVVRAKWEDVHIDRPEIADLEVASMFCPHCNRWHNEVYQYGNPIEFANFCPHCGADMRQTGDENV